MRKVIFILGLLILAACNNKAVAYATHDSESLGISFEYPESWVLEASAIEVNVATDEALFAAQAGNFTGGAVANFSAVPLAVINGDVQTALAQFTDFVATNEDVEQANEIETLVIDGHEAAQARVDLANGATLLVTMIEGEEAVILIAAVFDDAQYQEMITHVVETVSFAQ